MSECPTIVTILQELGALIDENIALKRRVEDMEFVSNGLNRKKLSKSDVKRIREMKRNGCTQSDIAECFDVNPATISRICRGQYHK